MDILGKPFLQVQSIFRYIWNENNYNSSPQTLLLKSMEELGELNRIVLYKFTDDYQPSEKTEKTMEYLYGKNADMYDVLASEVGDVMMYLFHFCHRMNIVPKFKVLDDK